MKEISKFMFIVPNSRWFGKRYWLWFTPAVALLVPMLKKIGIEVELVEANIDNLGNVHPDTMWWHYKLGNVRERPFSEIWTDLSNPLMKMLKDKKLYVKGRCASCRWLDICGGNFRVRAEAATGDLWACDPACYLTDEEIA